MTIYTGFSLTLKEMVEAETYHEMVKDRIDGKLSEIAEHSVIMGVTCTMGHSDLWTNTTQFTLGVTVESYQDKARRLVYLYVKSKLEKTDKHVTFSQDEVYVVWFTKTLKNWKCLISTTLPDGMYYEVTYNGHDCEAYIDAYKKFDNVCIKDEVPS